MTHEVNLGTCLVPDCSQMGVVVYSDGGVWCADDDMQMNGWCDCDSCATVGRYGDD